MNWRWKGIVVSLYVERPDQVRRICGEALE